MHRRPLVRLVGCVVVALAGITAVAATQARAAAASGPVTLSTTAPSSTFSTPPDKNPLATFNSISCWDSADCVAVGSYDAVSGVSGQADRQGMIETFASPVWSGMSAPLSGLAPAASSASPAVDLVAVSCPSLGWCVAVGDYVDSTGTEQGLIETLSNGAWSATSAPTGGLVPSLGAPGMSLSGLACPHTNSCVAVGDYVSSTQEQEGLIETLSGSTWTPLVAPTLANTVDASLSDVSCVSASSCVAVGNALQGPASGSGLIENLQTGSWTPSTASTTGLVPAPANLLLDRVSCSAGGACLATGVYAGADGVFHGIVATDSASTWTFANPPLTGLSPPAGSGSEGFLDAVSCTRPSGCVAVGHYTDSSSDRQGLIESYAQGVLTPTSAPTAGLDPAVTGNPSVSLDAVSCFNKNACMAVGSYDGREGLLETLMGGTWSAGTASMRHLHPGSARVPDAFLSAATCTSATSCMTAGSYHNRQGREFGFVDVPPTTNLVKPAYGSPRGGTTVVVRGEDFTGATKVLFGTIPAAKFVVNRSGRKIAAVAPAGVGTVDVTVVCPLGTSPVTTAATLDYAPAVVRLGRNTGPVVGGTRVKIKGMNFATVTGVSFGARPAASFIIKKSDKRIIAVAPPGVRGPVNVTVTSPGGTSALVLGDVFTYF